MTVSDAIYGASGRYVSRQRMETMLDYEYRLMTERLAATRGETTRFFVFADTVATKSYTRKDNWHGWMGIRFQTAPGVGAFADHPARQPAGPRDNLAARGHRHSGRQPDPRGTLRGRCGGPGSSAARRSVQRADRGRHDRVLRAGVSPRSTIA